MIKKTLRNFSFIDFSVFFFLIYFNIRLLLAPHSEDAEAAIGVFQGTLLLYICSLLLTRGEVLSHPRARGITHRFILLFSVLGLYLLAMREALAALQPTLVDAQLADIDRVIFGGVPAQMLEYFHTPMVTEWFAFFYYNYFFIVGLATIPSAFFGRSLIARGVVQGSVMIVCFGHILYTLVPGRGPYVALEFESELQGGLFWDLVKQAVIAQGALLDIFPSLHTALPSFLVIYLAMNRRSMTLNKLKVALWGLIFFATINIMVATLYLRWHYAVDVLAGLVLALLTAVIVNRTNPNDELRASRGQQPIFEPCLGRASRDPLDSESLG